MSQEMDTLKAAVTKNTTVGGSVVAYIQGVAVQIADAAGDRAASLALSAEVDATSDAMSAAILANTPGGPVVTP